MSLNFNYSKCSGPTTAEGSDDMHPTLNCLIWYTIPIGLTDITQENVPEWRFRLAMYERLFGTFRTMDEGKVDCPMELADVQDYVGLHTNAINLTRPKFLKQVAQRLTEEMTREDRS